MTLHGQQPRVVLGWEHGAQVCLERIGRWGLVLGGMWIICCVAGWISEPAQFYRSYLSAWLFWLDVSLGAMGVVMMHHLTGGDWGLLIRRLGEHIGMTLPLLVVLFIPIAVGMHWLFPWSSASAVGAEAVLRHRQPYLNAPFFLLRAVIYFAIWVGMAWYLRSASLRYDRMVDWRTSRRLHSLSAGGLVVYFLTMSFASVDWLMSRDSHWHSTVLGFVVICGQGIAGLCMMIVLFVLLKENEPFKEIADADQLNDLGNMLLTFVIVWTYMAFAQLLVIWMGNKQDDVLWYVQRMSNGWWWIGLVLLVLHFFVPFLVLLMRQAKRKAPILLGLCAGLLVLRAVDVFWEVAPSGDDPRPLLRHALSWMDLVFPIGMGGIWVAVLARLIRGGPLAHEGQAVGVAGSHGA